ncbi:epidermal retinol dehydrogenase 2-like [Mizuhopecten yessoensis]|uniref:epidermal retinol dehydrogenase 2-like n=1 Tax=Mizuhopecten yessoensis TaxID=6573 RepID=UPI000B45B2B4|nr:epidermal retinol dehydrogenase 2-like [Mizuhopecten yessoensis]
MCKAFLPVMMDRNHGHIVNVASSAGLLGVNGLCDYCASKFGAVGFDESLRFELEMLGKDGVHTTVVCPFYISTGMFEGCKTRVPWLLPILKPEEASNRIVDAVLCNQKVIILPRALYFFMALKGIIPTKVLSILCRYFGASNSMDDFKGRSEKRD